MESSELTMWAISCVDRYLTVFSLEASSGNETDKICEVSRVLGVSGKDWVSSISPSGTPVASTASYHLVLVNQQFASQFPTFLHRMT